MACRCRLFSVSYDLLSSFHGGNTGSNPVGDANKIKDLLETGFFAGTQRDTQLLAQLLFSFFVSRSIATTFPCALRLAGVTAWAYTSIVIRDEPMTQLRTDIMCCGFCAKMLASASMRFWMPSSGRCRIDVRGEITEKGRS
jgi:hypothetical protein